MPRIIVVLALPKKETAWLSVNVQRLIVKRSAYWTSLLGKPALPDDQQSVAIEFPEINKFDVDGLKKLMDMARLGHIT